jgi:DeoR/GlpR family transcriptional regulator of sugar metabolism
MLIAERHSRILGILRQHGLVSIRDLVQELDVSEVTVRRDIRDLAASGLIRRTHGGAAFASLFGQEPTYQEKAGMAVAEKRAIAAAAADLVMDNEVIGIGAGSTTEALAARITTHRNLTVLTNSLLVADVLSMAEGVGVIASGGTVRRFTRALTGMLAESSIAQLHVSTLFISGNGLTSTRGLSTPVLGAAGVDRALAAIADRIVVLADHTKIGKDTMAQTVPIDRIDQLITDTGCDPEQVTRLRAAGVHVTVVEPETTADDDAHQPIAAPDVFHDESE